MRIALATDDQKTLAFHLGRCKGFVMVEVEDGKEVKRWYVENTFAHSHHFGGRHLHHEHHGHHDHEDGHGHNHQGLLSLLEGAKYVVSRGMGRRIYDDLLRHGFEPFLTKEASLDRVLQGILDGSLKNEASSGCCVH